ncbi:UDP-N-acetylmuramoyl-L-alanine--D-glutamate ligase [Actinotignum urinale]|uniref:UDP-N-acetylmuramoyl-L-alanine--D-glutamate ligase n=1 Tax=Actinotignum urinale TaxID=190146 RepID=UPI002A7FAD49|nr:UDP-N-acetylmuramoyl-L-alanine--D-glutamate ligase [Actinotignum urinale]MDY5151421.1 UDP-N-acetylmuramoyl-L-alanine--D-glutamate ligase [Actinotignum urinale]
MVDSPMIDHATLTRPGIQDFAGKRVAVVGLGKSGVASLEALTSFTDARVSAWDASMATLAKIAHLPLATAGSDTNAEELAEKVLAWRPDMVIPAPAIPEIGPLFKLCKVNGIEMASEIELAWRLRAIDAQGNWAPWLCVTGTNGKTTTVTMAASILQAAGLGAQPLGNVGNPAITEITKTGLDAQSAFALELSSFQLRTTHTMQPHASICMNIADDHLEWHGSFPAYQAAKSRVYRNVHKACVYPIGNSTIQHMVDEADVIKGARAIGITLGIPSVGSIGIVEDFIVDRAYGKKRWKSAEVLLDLNDLHHLAPSGKIPEHIVWDTLAACALTRSLGISPQHIHDGLVAMNPGKHRIELIDTVRGVRYVDDSKATNAHATLASISAQPPGSVVWIAGGLAKGARFTHLVDEIHNHLRAVVVIGKDQEPWHEALDGRNIPTVYIPGDSLNPMDDAVRTCATLAQGGDTVLLAPASASMDQFTSYADRGNKFAEAVKRIAASVAQPITSPDNRAT